MICLINHFKLLLWDLDKRSYSYYIETSVDQSSWNRVIDFTGFYCRSWQFLHFPSHAVRYIRLVGTHNTENRWFHAVALEAYHVPTLFDVLISPKENVATANNGAIVIEGQNPDVLLNGDMKNYDDHTGFTYHLIGNKINYKYSIIIIRCYQSFSLNWRCFFLLLENCK